MNVAELFPGGLGHESAHLLNEFFTARLYEKTLGPGDQAIDAGANRGDHTGAMAARVGRSGKVYAFEPNPVLALALMKLAGPVEAFPVGLSDVDGEMLTLSVPEGLDGWASFKDLSDVLPDRRMARHACMVSTLDAMLAHRDVSRCRFVKIDVEGYELRVLRGATRLLERVRPLVVAENYQPEIGAFVAGHGYRVTDFFGNPIDRGDALPNFVCVPDGQAVATIDAADLRDALDAHRRLMPGPLDVRPESEWRFATAAASAGA